MIFDTIKEGIMEIMEERLRSFMVEIVIGQIRARAPSFRDFKAFGEPEFSGVQNPISSRHWVADLGNAKCTSFCPEAAKVGFASCKLRD